eukprot:7298922-Lingulodinium_polyedra.AAC.1
MADPWALSSESDVACGDIEDRDCDGNTTPSSRGWSRSPPPMLGTLLGLTPEPQQPTFPSGTE